MGPEKDKTQTKKDALIFDIFLTSYLFSLGTNVGCPAKLMAQSFCNFCSTGFCLLKN